MYKSIRKLENLRKKNAQLLSTLTFLLRCRDHKNKFERLLQESLFNKKPSLDVNRIVINLSSKPLSNDALNALAKGGNFAVTPKVLPVEDTISNIEAGIRSLPVDTVEEIIYE